MFISIRMYSNFCMIIHADMDAFYAAVEQRDNPRLRGRPVVVGGGGRRGVVSTCSYEARVFGIRSAMTGARAQVLCPHAVFVSPRMEVYQQVSGQIHAIFTRYTPLIEPIALDEAFLDVTGSQRLFGGGEAIAVRIRNEIQADTQLAVSVGVAQSKFVAKVASEESKPDGLIVVDPGTEFEFLQPLPLSRIWGAGPVAQERMHRLGFQTIGDLQRAGLKRLEGLLGDNAGSHYHRLSHGLDRRKVITRAAQSVSHERTFDFDMYSREECHQVLFELSERVARRLRKMGRPCCGIRVKFRYPDFETATRQCRLQPSTDDVTLFVAARRLFDEGWKDKPLRLLGVAADVADSGTCTQSDLFASARPALIRALDRIKDRHGERAIGFAGAHRG